MTEEGVESLIQAIIKLAEELYIPLKIRDNGVNKKEFESKVEFLAEKAFEDQCTTANPKLPLVSELAEIYRKAW